MDIQDFVRNVLVQVNGAVDEARELTSRDIRFSDKDSVRTIEFDIAVSANVTDTATGKTGIKVLEFVEAGGNLEHQNKNSTVSRVTFGLNIGTLTKAEQDKAYSRNKAHKPAKPPVRW